MGELLLRLSAWVGLLAWAGSEWLRARPEGERRARLLFTLGGVALAAHALAAFDVRHAWSQTAALADTARQTEAVTGLAIGAGLFVNYFFLLLWAVEAAWWWRSSGGYRARPRGLDFTVRGFFGFMFLNGAVVFVRGPVRWLGAAGLIAVVVAWYRAGMADRTRG